MRLSLIISVVFLFVANYWLLLADGQACFFVFSRRNIYDPMNGNCRYTMGGLRRERGVFIKSFHSCCRRKSASAWGFPYHCTSCRKIRGTWAPWSHWSRCSQTCGIGSQNRRTRCSTHVCAGGRRRTRFETRRCLWQPCCPVDGQWGPWSASSGCSTTCGMGIEFRSRVCSSPAPSCGGQQCIGPRKQFKDCSVGECAQWGAWASQGTCTATCGNGKLWRIRHCVLNSGGTCEGQSQDYIPCNERPCEDGSWCAWVSWGNCDSACQDMVGTRKRKRVCACPEPVGDNPACSGEEEDTSTCRGIGNLNKKMKTLFPT
nr:coadhesin-like [Ciona intestinalis]|eukprot:XP_004227441.2 coadhesin-like [Ciona intestinalis]